MKSQFRLTFALIIISSTTLQAQETIDNSWLTGTWTGEGFGGTMEEIWSAPDANGTMMGMFRHFNGNGSLNFYEFWVLDSAGLKLKHFNPDMTGWEEKGDFVTFEKVRFQKDKTTLKGLTYEKIGDDEMKISLRMKYGDEVKIEVFMMSRSK